MDQGDVVWLHRCIDRGGGGQRDWCSRGSGGGMMLSFASTRSEPAIIDLFIHAGLSYRINLGQGLPYQKQTSLQSLFTSLRLGSHMLPYILGSHLVRLPKIFLSRSTAFVTIFAYVFLCMFFGLAGKGTPIPFFVCPSDFLTFSA